MNVQKENDIAISILKTYEKNIPLLSQTNIGHFFERAYRLTGDKKYLTILASHFFIKQIHLLTTQLPRLRNFIENPSDFKLTKNFPQNTVRQQKRYAVYKKYPQIPVLNNVIMDLFFINSMNLLNSCCIKSYAELIDLLKKVDFDDIYYKEEVILNVSSFAFNSAILLNHLNLDETSLKQRLIKLTKDYYLNKNLKLQQDLDEWEYHTFIYNLTHIIIAESGFYEKNVSDHFWIIQYFAQNIQEITKNVNIDILAEVGLCIKLTKQEQKYKKVLNIIKKHILENYDIEKMLTPEYISKKEHTNSIIMLLFFQNDTWQSGPDLSKEAIFNNLNISL
jgi:hypothetical protein